MRGLTEHHIALTRQPFKIGPAPVGPDAPAYVVAEIGVNHDGQVNLAREMIHAAADAEVDAVKFQVFTADQLVTRNAPTARYQHEATQASSQYELLQRLELTYEEYADLYNYAVRCGVEFLATPFSLNDLQFLVEMGVRALKLASPDIVNIPLVEAAARSGLPVIASTGAASESEISEGVRLFDLAEAGPLALLHCVSSYPTREEQANLRAIRTLANSYSCVSGFSDHTSSLAMGGYAVAAGANIIEKHITLDRQRLGPDHRFSLEPIQLTQYVRNIRQAELWLGDGQLASAECEEEVRQLARRSVVASRNIAVGETIEPSMLTLKRPGGGISPQQMEVLLGRTVTKEIAADTPLSWEHIAQINHAPQPVNA